MVRFGSLFAAAFLASTVAVVAMPGCANQGEGERCDVNNNNDDCASGLTCQTIPGQPTTLCCPQPPAQPTVPQCFAGQAVVPDAGTDATTGADATTDAAQDSAESDAASDDAAKDATEEPSADAAEEAAADAGAD